MIMWLLGTLLFIAIGGGLVNDYAGNQPVLFVIGGCIGGLIGGSVFRAWGRTIKSSRSAFYIVICRLLLVFTALVTGFTFQVYMREQLYLLITAFVMTLAVRAIGKLVKMYYMYLQRRLTITRENRGSTHIIPRKKQR